MKIGENSRHVVIVDTSSLYTGDKEKIVNKDFIELWEKYAPEFNLELFIPQVVKGELKYQITSHAYDHISKTNESITQIEKVTGKKYSHRVTPERIKNEIDKKFDKLLSKFNARILSTPSAAIDWDRLIMKSIWREPPFSKVEKHKEKGFRDALIAETIIRFCEDNKFLESISLLCEDNLLRETLDSELKSYTNFNSYQTIADFRTNLDLTREELEKKFIKSLLRRAREKFYKRGDKQCLYYSENIYKIMMKDYSNHFDDPEYSEKSTGVLGKAIIKAHNLPQISFWEPASQGKFRIRNPEFIKVQDNNEYIWLSVITYVREYRHKIGIISDDYKLEPLRKIQILFFHVTWGSRVSKNGRFLKYYMLNIELQNHDFRPITESDKENWDLES